MFCQERLIQLKEVEHSICSFRDQSQSSLDQLRKTLKDVDFSSVVSSRLPIQPEEKIDVERKEEVVVSSYSHANAEIHTTHKRDELSETSKEEKTSIAATLLPPMNYDIGCSPVDIEITPPVPISAERNPKAVSKSGYHAQVLESLPSAPEKKKSESHHSVTLVAVNEDSDEDQRKAFLERILIARQRVQRVLQIWSTVDVHARCSCPDIEQRIISARTMAMNRVRNMSPIDGNEELYVPLSVTGFLEDPQNVLKGWKEPFRGAQPSLMKDSTAQLHVVANDGTPVSKSVRIMEISPEADVTVLLLHGTSPFLARYYGLVRGRATAGTSAAQKRRLYLVTQLLYDFSPTTLTLSYFLRSRPPLTMGQRITMCFNIALSILTLHHEGILHRNLHWENVFVDPESQRILLDRYAVYAGIPHPRFSAPETQRNGFYTWQSDIWALGVTLLTIFLERIPCSTDLLRRDPTAVPQTLWETVLAPCFYRANERPKAREIVFALISLNSRNCPVEKIE